MKFLIFVLLMWMALSIGRSIGLVLPFPIVTAILIGAVIADGLTTYLCLKKGGREGNPLVAFLFRKVGFFGSMVIVYAIWTLFIIFVWRHAEPASQSAMAFVYWLVPWNNYRVWKGLKRNGAPAQ